MNSMSSSRDDRRFSTVQQTANPFQKSEWARKSVNTRKNELILEKSEVTLQDRFRDTLVGNIIRGVQILYLMAIGSIFLAVVACYCLIMVKKRNKLNGLDSFKLLECLLV